MSRFALPDWARAFRGGERFGDATARVLEADHLVLPTGRIVACDPGYLMGLPSEQSAYTRAVPPGRYPVLLALLSRDGIAADHPNRESVACAAVRFRDAPVARWEMALRPGWDPSTLKPGFSFGYGVDSGTGCFVDEWAVKGLPPDQPAFRAALRQTFTDPRYQEGRQEVSRAYRLVVSPGLGEVLRPDRVGRPAWSAVLDPETRANIVCFRSGIGDGWYPSYFGLGADGMPVCLVTDFELLVRSVMGTLEIAVPVRERTELTHPGLGDIGIDRIHVEWRPEEGTVVVDLGEALYVDGVSFENRPGSRSRWACPRAGAWSFYLDEPLRPTARLLIEYTLRIEAL